MPPRRCATWVVTMVALGAPTLAMGEEPPPPPTRVVAQELVAEPEPARAFPVGLAVSTSVGYVGGATRNLQVRLLELGLLDLRLLAALHPRVTLDVWVPFSWILYQMVLGNPLVDVAAMVRVRPFLSRGFYLAPGIEVSTWWDRDSTSHAVFVGVPLAIGWEWVNPARSYATTMALRPVAGLIVGQSGPASGTAYGLGLTFEIGLGMHVERAPPGAP